MLLPQNAMEIIQKVNQPKVQEEVVAREIVINDTEPNIRQKLTRLQTQDEIRKNTGAVVITRGKYQPKGSLSDGEKLLYLHISASSHLKDLAERIRAVDKAASMVEEIINQGHNLITQLPLTMCVYLGFEADPSLNIANRIRGPNDQYINHIMNETGATVLLKGRTSTDSCHSKESLEPFHLYISSSNPKSLEAARILAENLLETIAVECGALRIQPMRTYSAVPPPPHLVPVRPVQLAPAVPPPHLVPVPPVLTSGTRYSGYYQGIYPQVTPLQQLDLALKHSTPPGCPAGTTVCPAGITTSPAGITVSPAGVTASPPGTIASPAGVTAMQVGPSKVSVSLVNEGKNGNVENKRSLQKRKFKELPFSVSKGSEFCKPDSEQLSADSLSRRRDLNTMPPPKKLVELGANGSAPPVSNQIMPPHPSPMSLMPPPPPKFNSLDSAPKFEKNNIPSSNSHAKKSRAEPASGLFAVKQEELFRCPASRAIWLHSKLGIRSDELPECPVQSILVLKASLLMTDDFVYAMIILWAIWHARNKTTFDKAKFVPQLVISHAASLIQYQTLGKTTIPHDVRRVHGHTCWTDGSWVNDGEGGIDYIIESG